MAELRAIADCPDCGGDGGGPNPCAKCSRCGGLGVISVTVDEDTFFADLPPGMSRDDAKALLARIKGRAIAAEGTKR